MSPKKTKKPPAKTAKPQTRSDASLRPKPSLFATIKIPRDLLDRLGGSSATATDKISELLELRRFFETHSLQSIKLNPFLNMRALDSIKSIAPFSRSTLGALRNWTGTEEELVAEALKISGRAIEDLAVRGLLRESAVVVQDDYVARNALADGGRQRIAGGKQVDELFRKAEEMRDRGEAITPSKLRTATGVSFRSCERFLDRLGAALGLFRQADGKTWLQTPAPTNTTRTA